MSTAPVVVTVVDRAHSIRHMSPLRRLFRPFWVIPALASLAAVVAGLTLPLVDVGLRHQIGLAFPGGPDGARSVLGTIASAMISVTGLVFSITMVVMQLASSQFSPRILQDFLSTRITQWTLGAFVASFVYSLTVLREVRGASDGGPAFVPQLSVTLAYGLVLTAFALFLAFIRTIMSLIQVSNVVSRIGDATCRAVEEHLPEAGQTPERGLWAPQGDVRVLRLGERHGHVVEVDERRIAALAHEHDLHVELLVGPGDFAAPGTALARVWGAAPEDVGERLEKALALGSHRSLPQDPAFGVRQLVDVAERALSPGINDPTTATQVLAELRVILGQAVSRPDAPRHVADEDGTPRVALRRATVEDLLRLAVEEVAHYGADTLQVSRALEQLLGELDAVALPEHRPALGRTRALVARRTEDD